VEVKPKVELCSAFMNTGFGAFNFSGGSALTGRRCTAAFAWYWCIRVKKAVRKSKPLPFDVPSLVVPLR
jgi:hypothetical protein